MDQTYFQQEQTGFPRQECSMSMNDHTLEDLQVRNRCHQRSMCRFYDMLHDPIIEPQLCQATAVEIQQREVVLSDVQSRVLVTGCQIGGFNVWNARATLEPATSTWSALLALICNCCLNSLTSKVKQSALFPQSVIHSRYWMLRRRLAGSRAQYQRIPPPPPSGDISNSGTRVAPEKP